MTTTRRWIALLLLAALLFAATGHSHSGLWWAVLAPILFVIGLIVLRDEMPEFQFAAPSAPARMALSARAPPLS